MKTILFIFNLMVMCSCNSNISYPKVVYVKCMPFQTTTSVPMNEDRFEEHKSSRLNFTREKAITKQEIIAPTFELLNSLPLRNTIIIEDYDIRASIRFKDIPVTYYFNWDKKNIMANGKFFPITDSESKMLIKLLDLCN